MKRLVYLLCIGSRKARFMFIIELKWYPNPTQPKPSCHSCYHHNLLNLITKEVAVVTGFPFCDAVIIHMIITKADRDTLAHKHIHTHTHMLFHPGSRC